MNRLSSDHPEAMRRKEPNALRWIVGIIFLLVFWFLFQLFGPSPSLRISKQTTYITEPLLPNGLPDYEQYLRKLASHDVRPDDNAAVLLVQALWPVELQPQDFGVVLKELGLSQTPSASDALIPITGNEMHARVRDWLKELSAGAENTSANLDGDSGEKSATGQVEGQHVEYWEDPYNGFADALIEDATTRPWTRDQIPPFGQWIDENQKAIDLVLQATKRRQCYFPSPSLLNLEIESLVAIQLRSVQASREGSRALAARCMWHVGEDRLEAAWQDALAIHRLARLVGQGPTIIEQLVAIAIDSVACEADIAILNNARLAPALARQILEELRSLPIPSNMSRSLNEGERVVGLDAALQVRSYGLASITGPHTNDNFLANSPTWLAIDWNQVLSELNKLYDQMSAATQNESRDMRKEALTRFDVQLRQIQARITEPTNLLGGLFNRGARSQIVANLLATLMLPSLNGVGDAEDRGRSHLGLIRVAAAIAVFRAERGNLPETLDVLASQILAEVPLDIYSGRQFIYRPDADGPGYLLYSVFVNGKDDNGSDFNASVVNGEWVAPEQHHVKFDESDMVIRLPLPAIRILNSKNSK